MCEPVFGLDPFDIAFAGGLFEEPFTDIRRWDRDINRLMNQMNRALREEETKKQRKKAKKEAKKQAKLAGKREEGALTTAEGKEAKEGKEKKEKKKGKKEGLLSLALWKPSMDVKERENEIIIEAELPGVKKKDISIELTNGILRISGEKREEKKEETERFRKAEIAYGRFERFFPVPKDLKESDIKATFENGVLRISFPKPQAALPKEKKKIEIFSKEKKREAPKLEERKGEELKAQELKPEEFKGEAKREERKEEGKELKGEEWREEGKGEEQKGEERKEEVIHEIAQSSQEKQQQQEKFAEQQQQQEESRPLLQPTQ